MQCTLIVGLPIRDDEARVVSHLAETSGEDGGDIVEGLEGGHELIASLIMSMIIIMILIMSMIITTITKIRGI